MLFVAGFYAGIVFSAMASALTEWLGRQPHVPENYEAKTSR